MSWCKPCVAERSRDYWCNQLIGLAGEDMDILRAIIANFERVNAETKARIAARPHEQGTLFASA